MNRMCFCVNESDVFCVAVFLFLCLDEAGRFVRVDDGTSGAWSTLHRAVHRDAKLTTQVKFDSFAWFEGKTTWCCLFLVDRPDNNTGSSRLLLPASTVGSVGALGLDKWRWFLRLSVWFIDQHVIRSEGESRVMIHYFVICYFFDLFEYRCWQKPL